MSSFILLERISFGVVSHCAPRIYAYNIGKLWNCKQRRRCVEEYKQAPITGINSCDAIIEESLILLNCSALFLCSFHHLRSLIFRYPFESDQHLRPTESPEMAPIRTYLSQRGLSNGVRTVYRLAMTIPPITRFLTLCSLALFASVHFGYVREYQLWYIKSDVRDKREVSARAYWCQEGSLR